FPEKGGHAAIEFSNRVVAVITIAVTLVSWIAARRTAGLPGWLRWAAFAVFAGTLAQIPLGGLTVIFDLNPVLVLMHFLLALAVFGVGVLIVGWLLLRHRAELPGVARLGAFLLGIVVVQMAVGEIQYRTHLPWWLVLVHVGLAAAVWGATVVLVTCIWRPPAPLTAH